MPHDRRTWGHAAVVAALLNAVALVVLGAAGTGLAYVLNLDVIRAAGPTVASTVTYVTPLWSTAVGVLLLDEPVGWNTLVGGAVVIGGVLPARSRPNVKILV
ncbi:EamA family transporter [Saccharothrix sp. ALI-22-I]|uniref:EamA family transporter n=1 Tax=Saccharothrix sp. ALI-22-I TaxID=1933778 RepID=UPI001EE7397A|nr:EamA family transporter [Saccharothrix sp. ALI-22-I]